MAGTTFTRRLSSLSDPTDPTTTMVLFILEVLALFFTLSTIVSTYYFSFRTSIFLGSEQSATTFYSLYQSCSTTTLYSDSVQAAAREMCAAVYFAEIFMVLAFISQCFASFLYLVTDSATLLPSGERAWLLLYKAHMTCTVFLVVALMVASGLFRSMRKVLTSNNIQEGRFHFSWGFAFHILAFLLHIAVVLVLVTATTNAGRAGGGPSARDQHVPVPVEQQQQQLVDDEEEADSEENRGKLKEALLTMEEGGEGLIGAAAKPSPSRPK